MPCCLRAMPSRYPASQYHPYPRNTTTTSSGHRAVISAAEEERREFVATVWTAGLMVKELEGIDPEAAYQVMQRANELGEIDDEEAIDDQLIVDQEGTGDYEGPVVEIVIAEGDGEIDEEGNGKEQGNDGEEGTGGDDAKEETGEDEEVDKETGFEGFEGFEGLHAGHLIHEVLFLAGVEDPLEEAAWIVGIAGVEGMLEWASGFERFTV